MNILIGHIVGDFLLQNDIMAMLKKKNKYVLILHCLIYTLSIILFAGWLYKPWYVWVLVFLSHYILDGTNLENKYREKFFSFVDPSKYKKIKNKWILNELSKINSFVKSGTNISADKIIYKDFPISFWIERSRWTEHAILDNSFHLVMLYFISFIER